MRVVLIVLLIWPAFASAAPGDLDLRFAKRGVLSSGLLEGGTVAIADRGDRILVGGGSHIPGVARITASGRFDTTFGNRGVARNRRAGAYIPFGLRRGVDGTVWTAGFTAETDNAPAALLRWTPGGRAPSATPHPDVFLGPISGGVMRPDGGAYVFRRYPYWTGSAEVRAITPDGATDRRFGGGTIPLCDGDSCVIAAIGADHFGVLAAVTAGRGMRVVRIGADGSMGRETFLPMSVSVLARGPGGAVYAAGEPAQTRRRSRLLHLVRIAADGTVDRSFGRDGVAIAGRPARTYSTVKDIAFDSVGRPHVLANRARRPLVARFNSAGRLDRRFGRDGLAAAPPPRGRYDANEGLDLVLDRRRGLLVVGKVFRGGLEDPIFGCYIREDVCAYAVRLGVWRFSR